MVGNAAETFGLRSVCGSGLVGNLMKNAITAHLRDEHFIIRVDTIAVSWMHFEKACSFVISFHSTKSRCVRKQAVNYTLR
jgi:hypothetical protein